MNSRDTGRYSRNEISHNLWLWLKGHNFTSLISVFGKKGPNKFSQKGNLLAFGDMASASAHPRDIKIKTENTFSMYYMSLLLEY